MKNGFFVAIGFAIWGFLKLVFKMLKTAIQVLSTLFIFLGLYIPLFYVFFGLILLATTDFTFGGTGPDQILYYIGLALSCVAAVIITIRNLLVRPISSLFESFRRKEEPERDPRDRLERYPSADRRYALEGEGGSRAEYKRRDGACFYRDGDAYGDPKRAYPNEPRRRSESEFGEPEPLYAGWEYGAEPYGEQYSESRDLWREPFSSPYSAGSEPNPSARRERRERRREQMNSYPIASERPLVYYSKRRPGILVKEYSDRFDLFEDTVNGLRFLETEYKDD